MNKELEIITMKEDEVSKCLYKQQTLFTLHIDINSFAGLKIKLVV